MKSTESIFDKVGKDPGFKVPEGYFESFAEHLTERLPEPEITPIVKPSLWVRVRPFVYMAAMFAGIWCMMRIFNDLSGAASHQAGFQAALAEMDNELYMDDLIMTDGVFDYDIIACDNDSIEFLFNNDATPIAD